MIELSRHIEALLLEHDCVIVPGLGGFVTQYVSASRVEEERLFLPPHRTVGFNAELTLNDGLLVQSYMQAYDASYPESVRMIEEAVADLKCELLEKGRMELKGIGTLMLNLGGTYNFEPNEAGVLSPEMYGLSSFEMESRRRVPAGDSGEAARVEMDEAPSEKQKKSYTLSLNKEFCNYVAAAVVAVVFYFLWATPIGNTGRQTDDTNVAVASMPFGGAKTETNATPQKKVDRQRTSHNQKTNATTSQKNSRKSHEAVKTGNYTLVLISSVPKTNAEKYVQDLHKRGIKDASVYVSRSMVRVIYGSYESEREAYRQLSELRKKYKEFNEAWVLALK